MDAVINIGSFLNFVNSISLSPRVKRWLGERLIHEAKEEEAKLEHKEKLGLLGSLAGSWSDVDIDTMKLSIQEGRQSDDMNKIMMFDEK